MTEEGRRREVPYLAPLQTSFSDKSSEQFRRSKPVVTYGHDQLGSGNQLLPAYDNKDLYIKTAANSADLYPKNFPKHPDFSCPPFEPALDRQNLASKNENEHIQNDSEARDSKLKRRTSRFGLAGLFSKTKPNRVEQKQKKLSTQLEAYEPGEESTKRELDMRLSRCQVSSPEGFNNSETADPQLMHRRSNVALRSKSSFRRDPAARTANIWEPPPLFQAYPQAVKYGTLRVPTLSAEEILRLDGNVTNADSGRTLRRDRRSKRPTASDVLSKSDWSHKIYVLVTSGYFLQYDGLGAFDRQPEKIMPLGKDSVAFASDAIPGKHYVLQIAQASDGVVAADFEASKSRFSKLGLRNEIKRSTPSFLLVLESAEEMSSWLVAVRREIHALGGKEYKTDEFRRGPVEGFGQRLRPNTHQRYVVKRDPSQPSPEAWEPLIKLPLEDVDRRSQKLSVDVGEAPTNASRRRGMAREDRPMQPTGPFTSIIEKRQSLATRASIESRSVSNTTSSIDQIHLDQLRESPRKSYASTATKTVSTSRGSSPSISPVQVNSDIAVLSPNVSEYQPTASMRCGMTPSSVSLDVPNGEPLVPPSLNPLIHSLPTSTPPWQRIPSPAAPNFSVPTFSKRFSVACRHAQSSEISKTQIHPTTLHEAQSPSTVGEDDDSDGKRTSVLGELQPPRKPSPKVSKRVSATNMDSPIASSPQSSDHYNPPPISEGETRFSHRFSSLEYSQGVSPIQLARQSPSPHPPPTMELPAIPGTVTLSKSTLKTARPSSTTLTQTSSPDAQAGQYAHPTPLLPLPPNALSAQPAAEPLYLSSIFQPQGPPRSEFPQLRKLRRPVSMQVRRTHAADQPPPLPTAFQTTFDIRGSTNRSLVESLPGTALELAPPTRAPKQPQVQVRKSMPRMGYESPSVSASLSTESRISVSSPAGQTHQDPAPHPFIPPIRISERKFRGSLDGPWNAVDLRVG